MGQVEVYKWMKDRTIPGQREYFTVDDVYCGLSEGGRRDTHGNIRRQMLQLEKYGFVSASVNSRGWRLLPYRWKVTGKDNGSKMVSE